MRALTHAPPIDVAIAEVNVFDGIPQFSKDNPANDESDDHSRSTFTSQPTLSEENGEVMRFRTIWISDIHLGTVGCQAELLLEFLKHTESNELFLVGDIIDGWQLARKWYWHRHHNDVVQKVLRKARKGTKVTFVAGNHDEFARQFWV